MICEMCGMEVPRLKSISIEGSNLQVCPKCVKFGRNYSAPKDQDESSAATTINERLQKRENRLRTKDVFESGREELALDYPRRIRKARASINLSQEELGKKINEKKSIVAKLETGDMVPDDKLVKKLERALGVSLTEKISAVATPKPSERGKGLTLGDFIKVEKK